MGVDIPAIQNIIHIGPPRTVREYMQETGRAGRDGSSTAVLFYNNCDIAKNKKGISEEIRDYCHLKHSCMRKYLLDCLDAGLTTKEQCDLVGHVCCSNCRSVCDCDSCCK
jgi:superfamily II DNA helicase RecQ